MRMIMPEKIWNQFKLLSFSSQSNFLFVLTLASGGMSSTFRMKGMGPRPRKNTARNNMRLTKGRKLTSSMVLWEILNSGDIVVVVEIDVPFPPPPLWHSSQCSESRKNTATPSMERLMNTSEMMRSILRPNLSIRNIVATDPSSCTHPSNIVLRHSPKEEPALWKWNYHP